MSARNALGRFSVPELGDMMYFVTGGIKGVKNETP